MDVDLDVAAESIYLDKAFENRILLYHAGEWENFFLQSVSLTCTQLICFWKGIVTAHISFFFFNSHPASFL